MPPQFSKELFESRFMQKRITMLGVGPMSLRVVQETGKLANRYKKPIALIPSRRQIDSAELGGGYVNNWSTENFVQYIRSSSDYRNIVLSRDHSGPWQGRIGVHSEELTFENALYEAKKSLLTDIEMGFDILHIDPSLALSRGFSEEQVEEISLELIEFCFTECNKRKMNFIYEYGADEQSSIPETMEDVIFKTERFLAKLSRRQLPKPVFIVIQTGTKVMEMRNIGSFNSQLRVEGFPAPVQYVPEVINYLSSKNLYLKEHNADYLSDQALSFHRRFGIHAANVAPEFGVVETRAIIEFLLNKEQYRVVEQMEEYVFQRKRWQKWLIPDSRITRMECLQIAGHYHFGEEDFQALIQSGNLKVGSQEEMDLFVRESISKAIERYLVHFGYGVAC